jgi:hypothetical protein
MNMEMRDGMTLTEETEEFRENPVPCHFVHHESHTNSLGRERPELR